MHANSYKLIWIDFLSPTALIYWNGATVVFISFIMIKEELGMADRVIVCKDCKADFIFTESEQEFYKEKGFENDPVRCPNCRRARKAQKDGGAGGRDHRGGNRGYGKR